MFSMNIAPVTGVVMKVGSSATGFEKFENQEKFPLVEKPSNHNIMNIFVEMMDDMKRMRSPFFYEAGLGALALRIHCLKYLANLDLNKIDHKNYYNHIARQLYVTTQHVFEEIRLLRPDLLNLYARRIYWILAFENSLKSGFHCFRS